MFFAFSLLLFHFPCLTFDVLHFTFDVSRSSVFLLVPRFCLAGSHFTYDVWLFSFLPFYFCLLILVFYSFSRLDSLIKIVFNFPVFCYEVNLIFESIKQLMPGHNKLKPAIFIIQFKYIKYIFFFN